VEALVGVSTDSVTQSEGVIESRGNDLCVVVLINSSPRMLTQVDGSFLCYPSLEWCVNGYIPYLHEMCSVGGESDNQYLMLKCILDNAK